MSVVQLNIGTRPRGRRTFDFEMIRSGRAVEGELRELPGIPSPDRRRTTIVCSARVVCTASIIFRPLVRYVPLSCTSTRFAKLKKISVALIGQGEGGEEEITVNRSFVQGPLFCDSVNKTRLHGVPYA